MKSILLASSLVLSAALFTPAFAAAPVHTIALDFGPGASPATVRSALGAPAAVFKDDLWIYWNFTAPYPAAANPEFDTLVVLFTHGRVTGVKITDGRVVRWLLAEHAAQVAKAAKSAVATK